jgi:microcystin-dependent protein
MSQPFVGQVIMFGGNFAPAGWMTCSGQLVPISEYETLFNLIGTTYGGDGQTTFGIPDLQGRVPIHNGQGSGLGSYVIGQKAGSETVTVTTPQLPSHNHLIGIPSAPANQSVPSSSTILATESSNAPGTGNAYTYAAAGGPQTAMVASSIGSGGGSQPHNNIQPVMAVTYCISLFGIFPSQN